MQYMLIHGDIIWEDADNEKNTRPEVVTVRLSQGESVVQQVTVTPDMAGNWIYESKKVPLYSRKGASKAEAGLRAQAGAYGLVQAL